MHLVATAAEFQLAKPGSYPYLTHKTVFMGFYQFCAYLRIHVHRVHEHAQSRGSLGHLRHHVYCHVGVLYVWLYLLQDRRGDIVLYAGVRGYR